MSLNDVQLLLADVAFIIILARLLGTAAKLLGQPPVLGEILAGILLGPTFFHGAITKALFPTSLIPPLTALADIGLVLFMFVVGYEVDLRLIRGRERVAVGVSHRLGHPAPRPGHGAGRVAGPPQPPAPRVHASRCSSAPRWPPPRSPSWPASSPTGACTGPGSAASRWPARRSRTCWPGSCWPWWSRWPGAARSGRCCSRSRTPPRCSVSSGRCCAGCPGSTCKRAGSPRTSWPPCWPGCCCPATPPTGWACTSSSARSCSASSCRARTSWGCARKSSSGSSRSACWSCSRSISWCPG